MGDIDKALDCIDFPSKGETLATLFFYSTILLVMKNSPRKNYISHKFFMCIWAVFLKDLTLSVNNLLLTAS